MARGDECKNIQPVQCYKLSTRCCTCLTTEQATKMATQSRAWANTKDEVVVNDSLWRSASAFVILAIIAGAAGYAIGKSGQPDK